MNSPKPRCENCGAELPSANAVCAHCDNDLAAGKHVCPACGERFDRPGLVWWPTTAPWYMPQRQRSRCPHCECLLRDRKQASFSRTENIALFVALLLAFSVPWHEVRQVLFVAIMGLWLLLIVRRTKWSEPDESRYARDNLP